MGLILSTLLLRYVLYTISSVQNFNNIIVLITQSYLSATQASTSFKWLDMCTYLHVNRAHLITEALCLVTYVSTAVLNNCYSKVVTYTALA